MVEHVQISVIVQKNAQLVLAHVMQQMRNARINVRIPPKMRCARNAVGSRSQLGSRMKSICRFKWAFTATCNSAVVFAGQGKA